MTALLYIIIVGTGGGGSDNITVQNSILWADIAHPINVGGHGDPESLIGETIENLIFRNIDILEHDEDDVPYQGCMAIDAGDRNRVKNILLRIFGWKVFKKENCSISTFVSILNMTNSPDRALME